MSRTLTVSEARAALPQILDRVAAGEEVVLTRHGKPVAVVVRPDALRARRADRALSDAATLGDVLGGAREKPSAGPGISAARADELVAGVHADRSVG